MVGVNSKKIRHLVILDIDEMKRSKLGMKTKKMVKNEVNIIYKQCGKREYFHESYLIGISERGKRK